MIHKIIRIDLHIPLPPPYIINYFFILKSKSQILEVIKGLHIALNLFIENPDDDFPTIIKKLKKLEKQPLKNA